MNTQTSNTLVRVDLIFLFTDRRVYINVTSLLKLDRHLHPACLWYNKFCLLLAKTKNSFNTRMHRLADMNVC